MRSSAAPNFARRGLGALTVLATLAVATPAAAQEPPDTLQLPDSLVTPDSAAVQEAPDSVSADTIFYNLPRTRGEVPAGFATGVWSWDRDAIMASGANTLIELFAEVPGLIGLVGGDYGTPSAISAFGLGGGGVRVFRDGFEVYPVEGGVVDLQHVGLAGIARVRLDRSMGVMNVELFSHEYDDGRTFSVVEAGTGDLDTNTFRGVFADPTALGGSVAGALERADTRGIDTEEGGNRTGTWARYQWHRQDRAGIALDFRRMGSQTKVPGFAPTLSRTDVNLRGSLRLFEGVVAEAYTGRSSLNADDAGEGFELWGGKRLQHGFKLGLERSDLWVKGEMRLIDGGDLPSRTIDVTGGLQLDPWGGVAGGFSSGRWRSESTSSVRARAWAGPLLGLSAFAAFESGTFGSRSLPVVDGETSPAPPLLPQRASPGAAPVIVDRTTLRFGGSLALWEATLSGAVLVADADADVPLNTELDLGGSPVAGLERTGFEAWASIPTPMNGLRLEGSYQRWDEAGPYLPQQVYRGSFEFHRVYKESENLELWWSLGVRGHDPMTVFVADDGFGVPGLQGVPFYQSWYGRVQVRIVTVRIFFTWENFTLRQNLQTFPGRRLPFARTLFGLRWDMWN